HHRLPLSSTLFPYTTLFRSPNRLASFALRLVVDIEDREVEHRLRRSSPLHLSGACPEAVAQRLLSWHRSSRIVQTGCYLACRCIDRKSTRLNSSHDQISYAV